MSQTQYKVEFASSVELYTDRGRRLYRINAKQAARLYREGTADDMLGSRIIRALKLRPANVDATDPREGFVPNYQRLSSAGRTHREHLGGKSQKPTVAWHMAVMGTQTKQVQPDPTKPPVEVKVPVYAPAEVRDIYLNVLTERLVIA